MDGIMTSKLFTTRQGTILLGVIAAVIAAVALIVYLNHYRNSINNNTASPVLVSTVRIPKGTPGDVIAGGGGSSELFRTTRIAKSALQTGAFVDASALAGMVAVKDIAKGEQLTADDFAPSTNRIPEELSPNQRGVAVSLGSPQQVGNNVQAGDYVDVWVLIPGQNGAPDKEVQLSQDVYVLGANGGNAILRANSQLAGQLVFAASENYQMWLVLRPSIAPTEKTPPPITKIKAGS